ncbi:MAG TPA: hypothetical protein PKC98_01730 [Candidatus Melainabacteria bacterium]|nr:hypothetical protein [Candidatus Melainabacteria bacterium]
MTDTIVHPRTTDTVYRESFKYSPSWGCTLYLRPDGVGFNFSCRDHGDPEPVDTVHEFGVSADEFIDMLMRVEAEGIARSGEFSMERRAEGDFRLTFQNSFDGKENHCSFSEDELVNMMRMRRLFTGR